MKFKSILSIFLVCSLTLVMVSVAQTSVAAEKIGKVTKQRADAYGTLPGDDRERKFPRYNVFMDELIETSGGAAILIEMLDDTELYLGERASLVLDEFVYDPSTSTQQRAVYNFTLGVMRFVSGEMVNDGVSIITPSAAIGLRGSDAVIMVAPDGTTVVNVLEGVFSVQSLVADSDPVTITANQSVSVGVGATVSVPQVGIQVPDYTPNVDEKVSDFDTDIIDLTKGGAFEEASPGRVSGSAGDHDDHDDHGDDHGGDH